MSEPRHHVRRTSDDWEIISNPGAIIISEEIGDLIMVAKMDRAAKPIKIGADKPTAINKELFEKNSAIPSPLSPVHGRVEPLFLGPYVEGEDGKRVAKILSWIGRNKKYMSWIEREDIISKLPSAVRIMAAMKMGVSVSKALASMGDLEREMALEDFNAAEAREFLKMNVDDQVAGLSVATQGLALARPAVKARRVRFKGVGLDQTKPE